MSKPGKRIKALREKIDSIKSYELTEACKLVCETAKTKFDETVDVVVRLGVDPKKADQNIRGAISLPHGLGKEIRVAVFAKGEKANEAKEAGADLVGAEDLAEEIKNGNMNFDTVIATPDMMVQVGKIGKLLGPRGLMPSPKTGSVTFEVAQAVKAAKAGRSEYKLDKEAFVHTSVGKASFGPEKLKENVDALITALNKAKPSSSKGVYLQFASISSTMGPGITLDLTPYRAI